MDYSELVARLREVYSPSTAGSVAITEAADALEAQGRRLALMALTEYERDLSRRSLAQVEARLAEAEKDLATTQQCFEERGEVLGQYIHRLTEAEALLREARRALFKGIEDDTIERIDAFLTPPPAPEEKP